MTEEAYCCISHDPLFHDMHFRLLFIFIIDVQVIR